MLHTKLQIDYKIVPTRQKVSKITKKTSLFHTDIQITRQGKLGCSVLAKDRSLNCSGEAENILTTTQLLYDNIFLHGGSKRVMIYGLRWWNFQTGLKRMEQ